MALTIQESEFRNYYTRAIKAFNFAVYNQYKNRIAGIPQTKEQRIRLQEIRLVLLCVGNWDQGRFTHLNFVNYLERHQMLEIFKRIDELT